MNTQRNTQSRKTAKKTAAQHRNKVAPHSSTKDISKPKATTPRMVSNTSARASTKLATVIEMLQRPDGATISGISKATEWLPHTVRGFLSGTIKKKLSLKLTCEKVDGVRVYRIEG